MCVLLREKRFWIVSLSIVVVCGCEREPTAGPAPVVPTDTIERVSRIVVSDPPARFVVGDSTQFTALVLSQTSRPMEGQLVQWTSSDPSIASVNEQGIVRGESVGNTTIIAQVGDKAGTKLLSVSRDCRQAVTNLAIGEVRGGFLSSATECTLLGQPVDGWKVNLSAPALLQFDLKMTDYFANLVLTDAELKTLAQSWRNTPQGVTLRVQLDAGSYIIWVGADGDDAAYEISVKVIQ